MKENECQLFKDICNVRLKKVRFLASKCSKDPSHKFEFVLEDGDMKASSGCGKEMFSSKEVAAFKEVFENEGLEEISESPWEWRLKGFEKTAAEEAKKEMEEDFKEILELFEDSVSIYDLDRMGSLGKKELDRVVGEVRSFLAEGQVGLLGAEGEEGEEKRASASKALAKKKRTWRKWAMGVSWVVFFLVSAAAGATFERFQENSKVGEANEESLEEELPPLRIRCPNCKTWMEVKDAR